MSPHVTLDEDALVAAADLVGRTGATGFEVGYLDEDATVAEARWYAHAQFQGARVTVEEQPGPVEAAEGLARRLMIGARCRCGAVVTLSSTGVALFRAARMADGTEWSAADAASAGTCRWTREGARWYGACGAGR